METFYSLASPNSIQRKIEQRTNQYSCVSDRKWSVCWAFGNKPGLQPLKLVQDSIMTATLSRSVQTSEARLHTALLCTLHILHVLDHVYCDLYSFHSDITSCKHQRFFFQDHAISEQPSADESTVSNILPLDFSSPGFVFDIEQFSDNEIWLRPDSFPSPESNISSTTKGTVHSKTGIIFSQMIFFCG